MKRSPFSLQSRWPATAAAPIFVLLSLVTVTMAQDAASPPSVSTAPAIVIPAPMGIPAPAPATDQPYAPQPILPGGIVVPIYQPGSKFLNMDRIKEAEKYGMNRAVPGRINSIVNIHNPSIEVHKVDSGRNTGAVVILAAGGGHSTLNVGGESADFVPYFFNYGINTVILRNRLARDTNSNQAYTVQKDAVPDALQSIRLVRKHAKEWGFDPNKIGIMGFSAGAELSAPAAVLFDDFDKANNDPSDPLAGVSSRPDFVGIIYPGPTPFRNNAEVPIPRNAPPAFITCAGAGDADHAMWGTEYFTAMLRAKVPNVEMHIYGNGYHPGSNGATGGLTYRNGTPYGTWPLRFIEWFEDLGFMQKPGVDTKAALDTKAYISQPPRPAGGGRGRGRGAAAPEGQPAAGAIPAAAATPPVAPGAPATTTPPTSTTPAGR